MQTYSLKGKSSVKELDVAPDEMWPVSGYVLQDDGGMVLLAGVVEDADRACSHSLAVCLPGSAIRDAEARLCDVLAAMHASLRVWWAGRQASAWDEGVSLDEACLTVKFQGLTLRDIWCSEERTIEGVEEACFALHAGDRPTTFFRLPQEDAVLDSSAGVRGEVTVVRYYPDGETETSSLSGQEPVLFILSDQSVLRGQPDSVYVRADALQEALTDYLGGLFDARVEADEWAHGTHDLLVTLRLYGGRVAQFRFDGQNLRQCGTVSGLSL